MRFDLLPLSGAILVQGEARTDARGALERCFCQQEFQAHGLPGVFVQTNLSRSTLAGTLRGLHFQAAPREEGKLIRCIRGAVYDVIVDLRSASPTFCGWFGVELNESNQRSIFVPPGYAHGFQTLCDHTELLYQMTEFYDGKLARGVRWNDAAFKIEWPLEISSMSERDRAFPDFL
jgi:dTDP-4-dehydrorhamnose 3,5-epimerase